MTGAVTKQRRRSRPKSAPSRTTAAALAGGVLLSACSTVVVPPDAVKRPQPVFILDHGRHTSLVLPHPDGLVRYAYGDWDWYAEVKTGATDATRAVLWPTRAGLARKLFAGTANERSVRQGVTVGIEKIHLVRVEADDVAALHASLDRIYRANRPTLKYNAAYDLEFVRHPEPYSLRNNSNHKIAEWLQALGCTVQGSAFWARWRVEQPVVEGKHPTR